MIAGNTQYEHFNQMGKEMVKYSERLGATLVGANGVGDDDDDLEGDFNKWCLLCPSLSVVSPLPLYLVSATLLPCLGCLRVFLSVLPSPPVGYRCCRDTQPCHHHYRCALS